jgi:phosphocarrier protein
MERTVLIKNRAGLHARPSALIAQTASRFSCDVLIKKEGVSGWMNGKSVLGIMSLEGCFGEVVIIRCEGEDEERAMKSIIGLFNKKFGEE